MRFIMLTICILCVGCFRIDTNPTSAIGKCVNIRGNESKEQLINLLGDPIDSSKKHFLIDQVGEGTEMLIFESDEIASGPIRIIVDTKTNKLVATMCEEVGELKFFNEN